MSYSYIDSTSRLLATAIETFAPLNGLDIAFFDDDWEDRKDALDCECVSFASVEVELSEALFQQDLVDSGHYEGTIEDEDFGWDVEEEAYGRKMREARVAAYLGRNKR